MPMAIAGFKSVRGFGVRISRLISGVLSVREFGVQGSMIQGKLATLAVTPDWAWAFGSL